jgi:ABC-type transporter Mla subunit MlaD
MSRLTAPMEEAVSAAASRHRVLGTAVLAALAVTALVILFWPGPFGDTHTVRAVFDSAESLGPFEVDVRMAGTPVGSVVGQRRIGDDALLEMELERSVAPLRVDARAEIRPRTTFEGTAFVELHPGGRPERLGHRAIPPTQTRSYVSIEEALTALRAPTRTAFRADVNAGAEVLEPSGRRGLREALRAAPRLTRFGAIAARAAQGRRGDELAGAVRGLAATTSGVAREERRLGPLVEGADGTFAALAVDRGARLDRLLAEMPARLASVRRGAGAVRRLVDRAEPLAVELRPGAAELGPTLRDLRPLLSEARPILAESPPLLVELRRTLDAAAKAAPSARLLAAALDRPLELLDDSILPTLESETRLGLPAYLQILSAGQGGGGSARPFQSRAEEGRGHFLRALIRSGGQGAPVPCAPLVDGDLALARALAAAGACRP